VYRRAVGVFSNRRDVEAALGELRDSGFSMDRVSVIAQNADRDEQIAGADVRDQVGNKSDEGAAIGAVSGGTIGGIAGLLIGLGTLAIPGIGPIMLAGATATALATTLAGAGIGAVAGSLVGALVGLGIPEERARVYNERVGRGHYLVIIDGTDEEIARAEAILRRHGIEEFAVYDQPVTSETPVAGVVGRGLNKHAIGYFSNRNDAEAAIDDLRTAGFPLSQISLVHRDFGHRQPFAGINNVSDRLEAMRLGLPDARARFYHDRINRGDYVVIVNGTEDEINRAAAILSRRGIQEWEIYDPSVVSGRGLNRHAIGYFSNRNDAEVAIDDLRTAGFPLSQISLVHRDFGHRQPFAGINNVSDRLEAMRLGLPDARARFYHDRINRGDYVVIVNGTEDEINRAAAILSRRGIQQWETYDPSVVSSPGYVSGTSAPSSVNARRALGVFSNRRDAEAALTELQQVGFPLNQVSLIAKDTDGSNRVTQLNAQERTGNKADEGAKAGAVTGGALGGLGGLLVGLGTLAIPGVGPVIAGGAAATALATAVAGGAIGAAAGGLTGGLVGLGIPENRARVYSDRLNRGDYLVIVDGTPEQIRQAEPILRRHHIDDFDVFDADRGDLRHPTAVHTTADHHTTSVDHPDPSVIIVDHRDRTV
jgi:hypothetical protein